MFLVRPLHWRHSAVCSKSNNKENFKACKGAQHKYTINRKVCDVITMWLPLPWNLHENTFLITYQVGGGGTCDSSFKSKYTYVIQSRVPWNKTKWQLNFYITVTHQSRMLFETSCSGQRNWLTKFLWGSLRWAQFINYFIGLIALVNILKHVIDPQLCNSSSLNVDTTVSGFILLADALLDAFSDWNHRYINVICISHDFPGVTTRKLWA